MKTVFKEFNKKMIGIPWYIRFCLWFCKPHIGMDFGSSDGSYTVITKRFRGKTYLLKEQSLISQKGKIQ